MFALLRNKKGQPILEYAVLIAVVIAALISMINLLKRHVQGGLRDAGSDIGDPFSPTQTTSEYNIWVESDETENRDVDGTLTITTDLNQWRGGYESTGNLAGEWWPDD